MSDAMSFKMPADELSVVIASRGRPQVLKETLECLSGQTLIPHQIVVGVVSSDDLPQDWALPHNVKVVISPKPGMCAQYNAAIGALAPQVQYVTIIDDDIELVPDYLQYARDLFASKNDLVAFNGHLLRNGDISRSDARALTQSWKPQSDFDRTFFPYNGKWGGLYGCNMNIRRSLFEKELFDERLPLYSHLSDTDFGFRAKRHGVIGDYIRCKAVHLQTRHGRVSEVKLGFAQIMNLIYLKRKDIGVPTCDLANQLARIAIANAVFSCLPDRRKGVDRVGRLKGNLIALTYLLRGRICPEAMVQIK